MVGASHQANVKHVVDLTEHWTDQVLPVLEYLERTHSPTVPSRMTHPWLIHCVFMEYTLTWGSFTLCHLTLGTVFLVRHWMSERFYFLHHAPLTFLVSYILSHHLLQFTLRLLKKKKNKSFIIKIGIIILLWALAKLLNYPLIYSALCYRHWACKVFMCAYLKV